MGKIINKLVVILGAITLSSCSFFNEASPSQNPSIIPSPIISPSVSSPSTSVETSNNSSSDNPSITSPSVSVTPSTPSVDDDRVEWIGNDQYPYYSTASTRFAMSLKSGWNLGNSLDAHTDTVGPEDNYIDLQGTINLGINEMDTETCYGNPKVSYELIRKVREAGYTTIRIPVSWHQHVYSNNNFKISDAWMKRVKDIVDYSLGLGFKVILNSHHDIDPSFIYPDYAHLDVSKRYIRSIWSQISDVFRNYDTNLIYEGCNEPRLSKESDSFNTELNSSEVYDCINQINQEFVDAIRKSNKINEQKRFLMVKGYADSPYVITNQHRSTFILPNDPSDRLLVSVHIYNPTEFAFQGSGGFDSNNDEDVSHLKWILNSLYQDYIMQGVGVVIGEWGNVATSYNLDDRVEYANFFVNETYLRHMSNIYWDNGNMEGEAFALFNRNNNTNLFPSISSAINYYWDQDVVRHEIKYYNGNTYLGNETVIGGNKALGPSLPWGYGYDDLYYDTALTNKFDINNHLIYNDLILYTSNYGVRPSSTVESNNDWGNISSQYISASNGAWYCNSPAMGKSNNYETQVNFILPLLANNSNYEIKFTYRLNGSNACFLVYNDATQECVSSTINMNGNNDWQYASVEFSSNGVSYGETRLTFSLGAIPTSYQYINFGIKDISITKK